MTILSPFKSLVLGLALASFAILPVSFAYDTAEEPSADSPLGPALTNPAEGHPGPGGGGHKGPHAKGGGPHGEMMSKLNLTADQKQKLQTLESSFRQEHAADIEALKAKMDKMKELRQSGKASKDEISALRKEIQALRDPLHAKRDSMLKTVLTPEQQQKLESMKQEMKAKHGKHKPGHS